MVQGIPRVCSELTKVPFEYFNYAWPSLPCLVRVLSRLHGWLAFQNKLTLKLKCCLFEDYQSN